jgi:hypothetical protein
MPDQEETLTGKELVEGEQVATGECKVAMSGPTCMDPDCPPCQHPEMERVEDRWPVKEVYRLTGSPPAISEVYFVGDGGGMPDEPQWYETATYYPASHPAVLAVNDQCVVIRRAEKAEAKLEKALAEVERLLPVFYAAATTTFWMHDRERLRENLLAQRVAVVSYHKALPPDQQKAALAAPFEVLDERQMPVRFTNLLLACHNLLSVRKHHHDPKTFDNEWVEFETEFEAAKEFFATLASQEKTEEGR